MAVIQRHCFCCCEWLNLDFEHAVQYEAECRKSGQLPVFLCPGCSQWYGDLMERLKAFDAVHYENAKPLIYKTGGGADIARNV